EPQADQATRRDRPADLTTARDPRRRCGRSTLSRGPSSAEGAGKAGRAPASAAGRLVRGLAASAERKYRGRIVAFPIADTPLLSNIRIHCEIVVKYCRNGHEYSLIRSCDNEI
ncbi:MAG: hypothetical protein V3R98_00815, partial [Alphaproteobacteria bacterium]